jgi:hypothetical protein
MVTWSLITAFTAFRDPVSHCLKPTGLTREGWTGVPFFEGVPFVLAGPATPVVSGVAVTNTRDLEPFEVRSTEGMSGKKEALFLLYEAETGDAS